MTANWLGWYLPKPLRRWYVFLPIDLLATLLLLLAVLAIWGSTITAEPFYGRVGVADDVARQVNHLSAVLDGAPLDIYRDYSLLCGAHVEWVPIYYMFYSMGLSEILAREPSRRDAILRQLNLCARGILRVPKDMPEADIPAYLQAKPTGTDPLMNGYVGVVLGLRRTASGDNLFDITHTRVVDALAQTIRENCAQTRAVWTSDQATQLYAIWLYDRATGADHTAVIQQWRRLMEERFIEPGTGLLVSHIAVNPDRYVSIPRGSSLAWTSILLADVLPDFARDQYARLCRHRQRRCLNFAAVTEYEPGNPLRFGDLDSGPLVFGFSPSASAFALGAHKLFGRPADFARGYRIFELFGKPQRTASVTSYYRGNAMGDAILLYAKAARPRN